MKLSERLRKSWCLNLALILTWRIILVYMDEHSSTVRCYNATNKISFPKPALIQSLSFFSLLGVEVVRPIVYSGIKSL